MRSSRIGSRTGVIDVDSQLSCVATRTRMLRALAVATVVLLAVTRAEAQDTPKLTGGAFAEGYSSPNSTTPAEIAYRMFTTSSRDCEELKAQPTRLEPSPREILLRVGEEFLLPTLVVQAKDDAERVIPQVPIALVIVYEAGVLKFETDQFKRFSITALRPAENGHVIVQLLCGTGEHTIEIPIRVVP